MKPKPCLMTNINWYQNALLPPPGDITICHVCWLVGSFVGVFVSVFVRQFSSGHRLQ